MVLVDTSVWVDFLKGRESAEVKRLESLIEEETDIFTTGMIVQELLSGIKTPKQRATVKNDFLRFVQIMPSMETHYQAAELFDACKKKGFTIRSTVDCLIAALAIEYDLSLLHRDRDFVFIKKVSPLKILSV